MSVIRQLSAADALFIAGDTTTTYNHTAGLMVLDTAGVDHFGFKSFRRNISKRIASVAQFRWRLHEVPGGLDRPYWVDDIDFDIQDLADELGVESDLH